MSEATVVASKPKAKSAAKKKSAVKKQGVKKAAAKKATKKKNGPGRPRLDAPTPNTTTAEIVKFYKRLSPGRLKTIRPSEVANKFDVSTPHVLQACTRWGHLWGWKKRKKR